MKEINKISKVKCKNYTKETSAKDAFSLWEKENPELVKDLNEKIKSCKVRLIQNINAGNKNEAIKYIDNLENAIIDFHCKFEDWLYYDK